MKDKFRGLDLTEDQKATINLWMAHIQAKRKATRFQRFYARIDAEYPKVDPETRERLAEAMYSEEMSFFSRKSHGENV